MEKTYKVVHAGKIEEEQFKEVMGVFNNYSSAVKRLTEVAEDIKTRWEPIMNKPEELWIFPSSDSPYVSFEDEENGDDEEVFIEAVYTEGGI